VEENYLTKLPPDVRISFLKEKTYRKIQRQYLDAVSWSLTPVSQNTAAVPIFITLQVWSWAWPHAYRQCRISNVANVAYATGLALLGGGGSRHPKLKRIKDAKRSKMNQNRLNDLILTNMEY